MKKRLVVLLVGVGLTACEPAVPREPTSSTSPASPTARAFSSLGPQHSSDDTPDKECALSDSEGPGFTQNKRLCYEGLVAYGRYQDVVDRIEVKTLGLAAQEKFFLGSAYFGLSNRTGARGLQCFYAIRARRLLEDFLIERQKLFLAEHSFGTTDDMKYVDMATKTLDALGSTTGCEESSHTLASLEHYGRAYAVDRIQGLFYKTEAKDLLRERFEEKLGQLNNEMREFVATASKLETSYGLTLAELDSGQRYLQDIQKRINDQFQAEAVRAQPNKVGGDDSFPSFSYDPIPLNHKLGKIKEKTEHFEDMLAEGQGEIARIKADISKVAGADSMDQYAARKEKQVAEVLKRTEQLLVPTNFWSELQRPARKGTAELQSALSKPSQSSLIHQARTVNEKWANGMKRFCNQTRPQWFCEKRGTP